MQQEGDGGKVVVCRPKGKDGKDENEAEDKNGRASFRFVMKIKSKEALRQDMHEEQFVRAQVRLLNLKAPPGVIQLQEILEDPCWRNTGMELCQLVQCAKWHGTSLRPYGTCTKRGSFTATSNRTTW